MARKQFLCKAFDM